MNKSYLFVTSLVAGCGFFSLLAATPMPDPVRVVANAPLRFEPSGSGFVTRGLRFSSSMQGGHMDLRTKNQAMRITFAHASANAHLDAGEPLRSKSNVIHGNDRTKWRTVPNYGHLRARDLYPGVDLVYYGNHGDLEYDLIVKPGVDPKIVRLQIAGVQPSLDAEGNLNAAFIQKRPVAYQIAADGTRQSVTSRYRRNADGTFGFALGRYDKTRALTIDPTLSYSLYVAGSSQDTIKAIGHASNGFIYVAGFTLSTDFEEDPNNNNMVPGGPQFANNDGGYDCFIMVFDPLSTAPNPVVFATYLGGSGDDILNDMYVSPGGLIYLTGYTTSTDFPGGNVAGYQTSLTGATDAFVVIYDWTRPVGAQLIYMSYMGGGTGASGNGVTADSQGRVFIVGTTNSAEVPVVNGLPAGLNGRSDAFVSGFDPSRSNGNSLIYSTFLGGSNFEQGYGITAAPDGTLWVVGQTYSPDFPLYGNSLQSSMNGSSNTFVAQIDPNQGGILLYSTYLGGSGIDSAQRVRVDAKGRVILTGYTTSSDFPVTSNAAQGSYKGAGDGFVAVLNPAATGTMPQLIYSTYFGGSGADLPTGLVTDANGVIYVCGYTGSTDLPITANALGNQRMGGQDGFMLKLNPAIAGAAGLAYSSYVGSPGTQTVYGVDVDSNGTIYVAGSTNAGIFDALNGVGKTTAAGDFDGFVMGISPQ